VKCKTVTDLNLLVRELECQASHKTRARPQRTEMNAYTATLKHFALIAIAMLGLAGCGGGSSNTSNSGTSNEGSRELASIASGATGTDYPLSIYVPPATAGARTNLPVIYVLDGESWFETLVGIVESTRARLIIVAIGTAGKRSRDFVPANSCTLDGGGHTAYLQFLRQELIPYVERTIGGDPSRRILFGHSHGGSFVLYTLFAEAPAQHTFSTYLASDSSISCLEPTANAWEQGYASVYRDLPVRLHLSYATAGNYASNFAYSTTIAQRNYERLTFVGQVYSGSHTGIVPQVLAEGIAFALPGVP